MTRVRRVRRRKDDGGVVGPLRDFLRAILLLARLSIILVTLAVVVRARSADGLACDLESAELGERRALRPEDTPSFVALWALIVATSESALVSRLHDERGVAWWSSRVFASAFLQAVVAVLCLASALSPLAFAAGSERCDVRQSSLVATGFVAAGFMALSAAVTGAAATLGMWRLEGRDY